MRTALSGRRLAAALVVVAVAGAAAATAATTAATTDTAPAPAVGTAKSETTLLSLSVGGQSLSVGNLVLNSSRDDATSIFTALTANGTPYGEQSVSAGSVAIPSLNSDTVLPKDVSKLVTVVTPAASMSAGVGSTRAGFDSLGSVNILGLPLAIDGTLATTTGVDGGRAGSEKTLVVRNLALPSIAGLLGALGLDIAKLPSTTLNTLVQKLGIVDGTITGARAALDAALAPVQSQLTAAEKQVADAQAAVDAAKADVTANTAQVQTANAALDSATASLQAVLGTTPHLVRGKLLGLPSPPALPAVVPTPAALPTVLPTPPLPVVLPTGLPTSLPSDIPTALPTSLPTALPSVLPTAVPTTLPSLPPVLPPGAQPVIDAYNAAAAAYTDAINQLNAATGVLNTANGLLNTASSTVNTLLTTVQTQVDALVHAIVDVLAATPLVSIDSFTIRTEASATTAAKGGQTAQVVGGELQGVHVLGNDVLQATIHRDNVGLGDLAGAPLELLNGAMDTVAGTLSSVLSTVPGFSTLSVPPPNIDLLSTSTATNIVGGFGTARTTLKALQITMPGITIPTALQKTPIGTLSVKAVGDVLTKPLVVAVGTMQDTASFRPSVQTGVGPPGSGGGTVANPPGGAPSGSGPTANGPTGSNPNGSNPNGSNPNGTPIAGGPGSNPQLPRTGLPAGAALLALGLVGVGLVLARTRLGVPADGS